MEANINNEIVIPLSKFLEFCRAYCMDKIAKNKSVKTVNFKNQEWLTLAGYSTGEHFEKTNIPYIEIEAVRAVPKNKYSGFYEPLTYHYYSLAQRRAKRPRGYHGMIVNVDDNEYVTTGEQITLRYSYEGTQKNLF